jgi:hypothetical protein
LKIFSGKQFKKELSHAFRRPGFFSATSTTQIHGFHGFNEINEIVSKASPLGWVDFGLFYIFNKSTPEICYISSKSNENSNN